MALFYGGKYTDLGPFRAISFDALDRLKMQDKTYGWTVEMQLKALKASIENIPKYPLIIVHVSVNQKFLAPLKEQSWPDTKYFGWIFIYAFQKMSARSSYLANRP